MWFFCFNCKRESSRNPSELKKGSARAFCSWECFLDFTNKYKKGDLMEIFCPLCGKSMRKTPCQIKRTSRNFCSFKCRDKFNKLLENGGDGRKIT